MSKDSLKDLKMNELNTQLWNAIFERDEKLTREMLSKGADVNLVDDHGNHIMCAVAWRFFNNGMKLFLEYGADPNSTSVCDGRNALHYAASLALDEMCEMLIDAGVDINARDNEGNTPLHNAAKAGNVKICELLIKNGADPTIRNGFTPLECVRKLSKRCGFDRTNVCEVLEKAQCIANPRIGDPPIHQAVRNGDLKTVKRLLENDFCINLKNDYGQVPMISAIEFFPRSTSECITTLAKAGASFEEVDHYGMNALSHAAMNGDIEVWKLIINFVTNINVCDNDLGTPLHVATYCGRYDVCEFLLRHGADVHVLNKDGLNAFDLALKQEMCDIPMLLSDYLKKKDLH